MLLCGVYCLCCLRFVLIVVDVAFVAVFVVVVCVAVGVYCCSF